ncbi:serine/threonine-protein kinase [Anaerolineales bacterium HSG6]|nr:serine/threonine-protein kinase [Anaerolineales bacterium HSG6]
MLLANGFKLNNRYRIEGLLGQGGFGSVYKAHDETLNIIVAIKESRDTSTESIQQFEREALMLARLRHPHLPRVTDHFTIVDLGQYLVMDFIEGKNLYDLYVERGKPTPSQAIKVVDQICSALIYLHQQTPPIIHRDVKPANVILTQHGQAMLVDFGIAKYSDMHSTSTGAQGRTPGYAPPEQYGNGRTDKRTDGYALGATLYMLLTGQHPPDAIDRLVHNFPLYPPNQLNPLVSPQLNKLVIQAMSLKTDKRYQSIEAFQQALNHKPRSGKYFPLKTKARSKRSSPIKNTGFLYLIIASLYITVLLCAILFGLSAGSSIGFNVPVGLTDLRDKLITQSSTVLVTNTFTIIRTPTTQASFVIQPVRVTESIVNEKGMRLSIIDVNRNAASNTIPQVEGAEIIVITIELENLSAENINYDDEREFKLLNQSDGFYDLQGGAIEGALGFGTLPVETGTQGRLVFQVLADETALVLEWQQADTATKHIEIE